MALAPILRPQGLNISGQCYLDVVPVKDVQSMPFPVVMNVTTDVVLKPGKSWIRVVLAPPASRLVENWVMHNGEMFSDLSITGFAAKDDLDKLSGLWAAKNDRWLVVLTCLDGDQLIAGRPEEGCRMLVTKRDRGDNGAVVNGYSLEFTNQRAEPVPFYQGTPPEPPSGECAPGTLELNGQEVATVASGSTLDLPVTDTDGNPVGEWNDTEDRWEVDVTGGSCDDATAVLKNTEGTTLATEPIPSGTSEDIIAPDATALLRNSNLSLLSTQPIPSGVSDDVIAPDATVTLKDSAGSTIGSPVGVPSGATWNLTAPDGTVRTTDGLTTVTAVKSNGTADLPQSVVKYKDAANADQVTAASNTEFAGGNLRPATVVPRRELKCDGVGTGEYVTLNDLLADTVPDVTTTRGITASWAAGDDETIPVVLPAEYQGISYAYVSNTGTNGTITVSVDGGSTFSAPPFTVGASGVAFRRTTYSGAGSVLYEV